MNKKLLLISLDGCSPDYIEKSPTPNLDRLVRAGFYKEIRAMAPTVTNVNNVSLVTGTYPGTHGITANYFGDSNYWELRLPTQPYFDRLRQLGILHDTPGFVAQKVSEICDDPIAWRQQSEIQIARSQFCYQFAHTSDNWLKEWKTELLSLKSQNT